MCYSVRCLCVFTWSLAINVSLFYSRRITMLTICGLRVTVYTFMWCDNQTYYFETCDAITTTRLACDGGGGMVTRMRVRSAYGLDTCVNACCWLLRILSLYSGPVAGRGKCTWGRRQVGKMTSELMSFDGNTAGQWRGRDGWKRVKINCHACNKWHKFTKITTT